MHKPNIALGKETSTWNFPGTDEGILSITKQSGDAEIYDFEIKKEEGLEAYQHGVIKLEGGKYYMVPEEDKKTEITFANNTELHLGEIKFERALPFEENSLSGTTWKMAANGAIVSFSVDGYVMTLEGTEETGNYSIDITNNAIKIDGHSDPIKKFTALTIVTENMGLLTKVESIQALLDKGKTPIELYNEGVKLEKLYGMKYAGGLIFYIDVNDDIKGIEGMVAATADQSASAKWGCYGTDISGLANARMSFVPNPETEEGARIGDGAANTDAILAVCNTDGIAASLFQDIGDEWFLPSRGELNLMYTNLHLNGHGGFAGDFYWSSTESGSNDVWNQFFNDGNQVLDNKGLSDHVRAAQAF